MQKSKANAKPFIKNVLLILAVSTQVSIFFYFIKINADCIAVACTLLQINLLLSKSFKAIAV